MIIEHAQGIDIQQLAKLDRHIPPVRLEACVRDSKVYVLKDSENSDARIVGVLRYSLFWQTIPFLDLLYLDETYRNKGFGTEMMKRWEQLMRCQGYKYVMTSTQADESAWRFYEKLGYRKVGGFFPPEQDAEEWMYLKQLDDK